MTVGGTDRRNSRKRKELYLSCPKPRKSAFLLRIFKILGAEGGTRTPTSCLTRPSNVRVCQFRHFGMK